MVLDMRTIKPQIGQPQKNEVLLKEDGEWLHFRDPYRLIAAEDLVDVLPALREIERMTQVNGWYAAGFISYEAASAFDPALRSRAREHAARVNEFPYLWFGLYPRPHPVTLSGPEGPGEELAWLPTVDRDSYHAAVEKIKQYIEAGRTYQVNYTLRLQTDFKGSEWEFFLHLAQNQNNHAAYADTGRYVIASASPELFFRLEGNTITCRPMKGTTRRGRTTAEDQAQAEWLRHSTKNRAENVMIVDMIRNDLGRIAEIGSVDVSQLFETERYPTLWQMTSTVTARTDASIEEILVAMFPCASITGAPKVSTMKIIAELEETPRKIYTGTIGTIFPRRNAKFSVAIRTALIDREGQKAEYGVGGGIVWDSTSKDEYAEALLKARVLVQTPEPFSLFETMLWTPEAGFFLYEKHIARLLDSADYFDIPIKLASLETFLEQISSRFQMPQRVRLLVSQTGKLDFQTLPFDLSQEDGLLKACLAGEPIDSRNIFLFHKTTRRDVYESARQGLDAFDDVLLYNEAGELTEFTIGNLVVEWEAQQVTPPIDCGVLSGTFRAH